MSTFPSSLASVLALLFCVVIIAFCELLYARRKMLPSARGVLTVEEREDEISVEALLDELDIDWRIDDRSGELCAVCDSELIFLGDCVLMLGSRSAPKGVFKLNKSKNRQVLEFTPAEDISREDWLAGEGIVGTIVMGNELIQQVYDGLKVVKSLAAVKRGIIELNAMEQEVPEIVYRGKSFGDEE